MPLTGNTAVYWGGGVMCRQRAAVNNCLIAGNQGGSGGGIYYYRGGAANHCTITGNTATNRAGGIYSDSCEAGSVTRNCIVWQNTLNGTADEWYVYSAAAPFESCCVTLTNGIPGGVGCATNDPRFLDAPNADFRIGYGSPCIDTGANPAGVTNDLAGTPRPLGAGCDRGAYEYDGDAIDTDRDGLVDNVCFVVSGSPDPNGWNTLLWPHMWTMSAYVPAVVELGGKRIDTYNLQLAGWLEASVLCHEMGHVLTGDQFDFRP